MRSALLSCSPGKSGIHEGVGQLGQRGLLTSCLASCAGPLLRGGAQAALGARQHRLLLPLRPGPDLRRLQAPWGSLPRGRLPPPFGPIAVMSLMGPN